MCWRRPWSSVAVRATRGPVLSTLRLGPLAVVLALGVGLSGCAVLSDRDSGTPAEKPQFPIPPGGLAKVNGGPDASWGVFQPVAMSWTGNGAPATFAPAMSSLPQSKARGGLPDADNVPPAAWPISVHVPPAGSLQQTLPVSARVSTASIETQAPRAAAAMPATPTPARSSPTVPVSWSPPIAPPPAFSALSAVTPATSLASRQSPASAGMQQSQARAAAVQQPASAAFAQPAIRPVQAPPKPASLPVPPRPVQPQAQPEVIVDYSVLARFAPAPVAYPALAPRQVQQLGAVTVDYSVLQN